MRRTFCALTMLLFSTAAFAADGPDWAYPVAPQGLPRPDPNKVVTVPGSDKKYTETEVGNAFGPPDWFPGDHAPMPKAVAEGTKPDARACSLCHTPTGDGHPESSSIAGLNANYIVRQLGDFATGNRKNNRTGAMSQIAKALTPEDAKAAAEYFAVRKPLAGYTKVVEAAEVPKSEVGEGAMRFEVKDGGKEAIGQRIIELPQDEAAARARNPRVGFIAYVPPGSIARGEALATKGGDGKTIACAVCHGEGLKGLGEVPAIAGRSPMYLTRQLLDLKSGARKGAWAPLMKQVVDKLDTNDVIALAAYVGSRTP